MKSDFEVFSQWELKTWQDYQDFANTIQHHWNEHYGRIIRSKQGHFTLITGGWSDNEEVQGWVDANRMFNLCCWQSSHRGGKTVYQLPKKSYFGVDKKTM